MSENETEEIRLETSVKQNNKVLGVQANLPQSWYMQPSVVMWSGLKNFWHLPQVTKKWITKCYEISAVVVSARIERNSIDFFPKIVALHMIQEFLSAVTKNQTVVNCLGLVNVRTSAGWSALHMAARNGHDSCVRTLVLKRYDF